MWKYSALQTTSSPKLRDVHYADSMRLHINNILEDSIIHRYADDSTVDAVYSGRASLCRENVE